MADIWRNARLSSDTEDSPPLSSDDSDPEFDNKDGEDFLANGIEAIIERPGRPSSGEARCLKVMTLDQEENWQKKFNMCVLVLTLATCFLRVDSSS